MLLESWGIRVRQIGVDVGAKGMQDEEIISLLHRLRQPTFLTRDDDFYQQRLAHAGYCLIYLAVEKYEAAFYARRVLRHRAFKTKARRMGCVLRVSNAGIWLWRPRSKKEEFFDWS